MKIKFPKFLKIILFYIRCKSACCVKEENSNDIEIDFNNDNETDLKITMV